MLESEETRVTERKGVAALVSVNRESALMYVQYVGVMRRLKTQHWRLSCKTRVGATVCNSCVCGSLVLPNIPHFLQGVLSVSSL